MHRGVLTAILVAMACLKMGGCTSSPKSGSTIRSQQLNLKVGGTQRFFLVSNRTTGFEWEINRDQSDGLAHITIAKTGYTDTNHADGVIGAPGRQWWLIRGISPGETTLRLDYRRPWEVDRQPSQQASVLIQVVN